MTYHAIETNSFKGIINNIEFTKEELFWATRSILNNIEHIFKNDNSFKNDIHFSEKFIEDISSEIEQIYYKYEDETYAEIADELIQNMYFENKNLSDLKFDYMGLTQWFDYVNENLQKQKQHTKFFDVLFSMYNVLIFNQ